MDTGTRQINIGPPHHLRRPILAQKHRAHTATLVRATSCFFAKLRYHVCVTRRKHDLPFFQFTIIG